MKNLVITCILVFSTFLLSAQLKHALRDENGRHVIGRGFVVVTNDKGSQQLEVEPVYFDIGLFKTGITYQIIVVKTDENIFF